ncbi:hypothetical protein F8388_013090, partial [Cannabis sativa]
DCGSSLAPAVTVFVFVFSLLICVNPSCQAYCFSNYRTEKLSTVWLPVLERSETPLLSTPSSLAISSNDYFFRLRCMDLDGISWMCIHENTPKKLWNSTSFRFQVCIPESPLNAECTRQVVDETCHILESSPWGPSIENSLLARFGKPQPESVIRVLRRLKDVNLAVNYFRWSERQIDNAHCPEAYNSLITVMARSRNFIWLDQILEEMSVAGIGPSNYTTVELVVSCIKSQKLREAFDLIQTMRRFKFRPAFSAYTNLIGALSTVHEADLMLTLFHQMQELGYEVSVHLFTTVIRVFAKEGRVDAALSLLDEMKSNSLNADIVLYNVCIDCFGKVGKVDMAWKFFHEMKANGLRPDDVTYTSMIGVLCKADKLEEAVQLFEQMDLNRTVPCAYAYNTMIMGYSSAGKFDQAYSLLERQKTKGCIPSVIAYNCILTCLGRKGKVDEALRIFEEMKKDAVPNLPTYNILIDLLCREGKLEAALKVQDAMKEAGLYPNVMTINIMIDRLCKAQKLDAACSIFEEMDYKVCTPNEFTFCSLIDGLGKQGRVDDAYKLYEKMLDTDKIPTAIIYTSLIRNFFRCGRKEDGHKIYKEMVQRGCPPDLMLLNTYMDCIFKAGETEKGRALFKEIKAQGFNPDVRSFSILIHGLIKAGFAHETYELFYAMKEQGCVLDTRAYNTVIDGFCKSGKVNKAYQLLEEMKTKGHHPTVVTYGSVVDGLAKIDRLDEAYMLFEEAKSKGIELNLVIYSSLIDGFGKVGRVDEAYLIMEELMQKGLTPNVYTWNCLLDALVKAEEIDEALVCFQSMKDLNCAPNQITYSILINGFCRVRKFTKAFVYWQEMQKLGLKPNTITYTTMISGLAKAGNIAEANRLFERLKASGGMPDSASYNAMIEGLSSANQAMDAYMLFEETRLKGFKIHSKTCVVLLDSLHKAECLEQAAIVGAVLKETAKSQHASRTWLGKTLQNPKGNTPTALSFSTFVFSYSNLNIQFGKPYYSLLYPILSPTLTNSLYSIFNTRKKKPLRFEMAMALRPIDNELPTTIPERPKKQAKVAIPIQKQPQLSTNDENKAPVDSTIEYIDSDSLEPIEDPQSKIQNLIEGLESKDWIQVCESLNNARRFALYHSDLLTPLLDKVMLVLVKAMKNPRSALCKTSIMASSDIFKAFNQKLLDPSTSDAFDHLILQLLLKASQDKRFVCEEADKALKSMVGSLTPLPLLQRLRASVKHTNLRIRAKAAVAISNCVSKMGLEEMKEYGLVDLIQIAADLLNDRLPEAREAARSALVSVYNAFIENEEEEKQEAWQNFCQSNLSPIHVQSVFKFTTS